MVNDSRFYYGVGLSIILISFVVFALGFEKRKPSEGKRNSNACVHD